MSGGIMGAQNGTLTFMVGSDKDQFDHIETVLKGMGQNVFHCGAPGTGGIAKICNNMILGIHMCAAAEGISLGEKLGIDPKTLTDILSVSTSSCWSIKTANPRPGVLEGAPSSRDYNGGFQTALMRKDISIAMEAAEQSGASVEFGQKAIDYYIEVEKKGFGTKDFGYVYQYVHKNKKL
jgi:3-hydroxyisobutyrate dehydrogenase